MNFVKNWQNSSKIQIRYLDKGVLKLHQSAMTKLGWIECSVQHNQNGRTPIYRLVSGATDIQSENRNFLTEDDDSAPIRVNKVL